ncbi:MAG: nuclear transport factor 2 family protein [Alphaproteobacteria bacterium]|nr:nuclear transport factor 2 family protein [Alphaproteobacteria bacterium]
MAMGVALLLVLGGRSTNAAPAFNAPNDVSAIEQIEATIQSATDMKKIIDYYAPNAVVLDIYAPGIYRGRKQIMAGFQPQLATIKSMTDNMSEMNVASDGRFACAAMQIGFKTLLKNGKSVAMSVREIDAFKKIQGKWMIVQQHISLPADPKTGMAVVNGPIKSYGPLAWSASPLPGPATTPTQAKQEIHNWMQVGAVSTSLNQLMQYYGPGNDVIVYDSYYPGELRGLKAIRNNYAAVMSNIKNSHMTMPLFVADSDGLFGVQIDIQDLTLTMRHGGTQKLALRQSDCMRRVGGKWYSFFEMISFPVDAKTGKAIMVSSPATH